VKAVPVVGYEERAGGCRQHDANRVSCGLHGSDGLLDLVGHDAVDETSPISHGSAVETEAKAPVRKAARFESTEE
jgi:hypothetical protein